jgi:hypothetical protein
LSYALICIVRSIARLRAQVSGRVSTGAQGAVAFVSGGALDGATSARISARDTASKSSVRRPALEGGALVGEHNASGSDR